LYSESRRASGSRWSAGSTGISADSCLTAGPGSCAAGPGSGAAGACAAGATSAAAPGSSGRSRRPAPSSARARRAIRLTAAITAAFLPSVGGGVESERRVRVLARASTHAQRDHRRPHQREQLRFGNPSGRNHHAPTL